MSSTTLVITNDFPPRVGGIESFVAAACRLLDDDVVVLTSHHPRQDTVALPYPVHRSPASMLLPTPDLTRTAIDLLRTTGARRVLFGAAAPLGLLAPALRRAGAERVVGLTHGHEAWWARVPGFRSALRRIGEDCDGLGHISEATRVGIAAALSPGAAERLVRIAPPVDTDRFAPVERAGRQRPVVLAAARLVPRKGIDLLLAAWQRLARTWAGPVPRLRIVGDGPQRRALQRQAAHLAPAWQPEWVGAVPHEAMPAEMAGADVFALPVRTRWAGLELEGLGMVFAEAAATGLPVLVGDSGGASETVRDRVSGRLLDPTDPQLWADALADLLADPQRRHTMGAAGRDLVVERFGAERTRTALRTLLDLDAGSAGSATSTRLQT